VTDAELRAARAWYERYRDHGDTAFFLAHVHHHLPALLAEVDRLRRVADGSHGLLLEGAGYVAELEAEVERLRGLVGSLAARVAAQSELLSRRAEGASAPPAGPSCGTCPHRAVASAPRAGRDTRNA
jgi:hypothetical protein